MRLALAHGSDSVMQLESLGGQVDPDLLTGLLVLQSYDYFFHLVLALEGRLAVLDGYRVIVRF